MVKRHLSDLFVVGKYVSILGEDGEEAAKVYMKKLSPVDMKTATRKANAARAYILSASRDKNSDEYRITETEVRDMDADIEQLVDLAITPELVKIRAKYEAEVEAEEDWKDNLQALYDAWRDGLEKIYMETKDTKAPDVEATRVWNELQRYTDQVNELVEDERVGLIENYVSRGYDRVVDKLIKVLMEFQADQIWLDEFRLCQVWLSVFENHEAKERYFPEREDVVVQPEILKQLIEAYATLGVDVEEGKS